MKVMPTYYAIIPAIVRYDEDLQLGARLLYGEITALSGQSGRCWASDQYFVDLYKVSKRTIQLWLKSLEDKNYINRVVTYKENSKEIDKRFITITPHLEKYNSLPYGNIFHDPMEIDCVDNNTSINSTSINNKDYGDLPKSPTTSKYDKVPYFNEFWELYPNKKGKGQAVKTFQKQVKNKETFDLIVKDLERRKGYEGWIKEDGRFIQHPSTYLNQEMWLDEYEVKKVKQPIKLKIKTY